MPSDPLNQKCFRQPHWLLEARGFDAEAWYDRRPDKQEGRQNGGIVDPQQTHLSPGHRYYRFAGATTAWIDQLSSPWWMSFDTFQIIRQYADRNDLGLPHAARLFLAIPEEWSRMDRVISAQLAEPLDAYAGRGKVATGTDGNWTPIQHMQVTQIFIPGLRVNRMPTQLASQAWQDVRTYFAHNMATAR